MKLLVAFFAMSLGIAAPCFAMQPPQRSDEQEEVPDIGLTMPYVNKSKKRKIKYLNLKNTPAAKIGYIIYFQKNENSNNWFIDKFHVDREYRDIGLGRDLFKECIADIKGHGGKIVTWTACPTDAQCINLETLMSIYQHIIEKLGFSPDALSINAEHGLGIQVVMTLRLS